MHGQRHALAIQPVGTFVCRLWPTRPRVWEIRAISVLYVQLTRYQDHVIQDLMLPSPDVTRLTVC